MPIVETDCDADIGDNANNFHMLKFHPKGKVFYDPEMQGSAFCGIVVNHEAEVVAFVLPHNEEVRHTFHNKAHRFATTFGDGTEMCLWPLRPRKLETFIAQWLNAPVSTTGATV